MPESPLTIRPARDDDWGAIWTIFAAVVARGDTYAYPPDIAETDARRLWLAPGVATWVAEADGTVVGTYVLKPNQPGLGDHVANAGYMVAAASRGRGVGGAMCEHSMDAARAAGYRAMQFNFVVSTNAGAVALWRRLGFAVVGTVPRAFRHRERGEVDVYVMHRFL